jgi:hypothetical protein
MMQSSVPRAQGLVVPKVFKAGVQPGEEAGKDHWNMDKQHEEDRTDYIRK